jgi:hypothetical protein
MGVGDGSSRAGVVVGARKEVEAGLVVALDVDEGAATGKPCEAHAVQRTRM